MGKAFPKKIAFNTMGRHPTVESIDYYCSRKPWRYSQKYGDSTYFLLRNILEQNGYTLISPNDMDDTTYAYFSHWPNPEVIKKYPQCKIIYYAHEPETGDIINSKRNFTKIKECFDYTVTHCTELRDPDVVFDHVYLYSNVNYNFTNSIPFAEKKLSTMIASCQRSFHPKALYHHRMKVIRWFQKYHPEDLDVYGKSWPKWMPCNKGVVECKLETHEKYKFAFCFDNATDTPGYIGDKIFDCFAAKSVPIYLGDKNIDEWIPSSCYIKYQDFSSMEECYNYLKDMTEERYSQYLQAIEDFHGSEAEAVFSTENAAEILLRILEMPKRVHVTDAQLRRLRRKLFQCRVYQEFTRVVTGGVHQFAKFRWYIMHLIKR